MIWQVAGQIWSDHPWLGGGAAAYNVLFDQYRPRGFTDEPIWAHNDYLNTLSDYGLVGFAWWLLAALGLLALGWRAVQKARRGEVSAGAFFSHWPARLGLFLGLVAFALHLAVDFHTKIPALAMASALVLALLLRDEAWLVRPLRPALTRRLGLALALGSLGIATQLAVPLYQAEAHRYSARRLIDQYAATGRGEQRLILTRALASFSTAVKIDPAHGQAWADLSYATAQSWHLKAGDLVTLGRRAEQQADRALALAPLMAEFWVRKGVALDMQARPAEGEICFKQALQLAPQSRAWWYYYAYHLSEWPERKAEALRAVEMGLSLDPSFPTAVLLRQQLVAPR
jgi:tetratricopeptide (TPR) repeat protein